MEAAIALEKTKEALQASNDKLQQLHYEGVCSLINTRIAEIMTLQQRVDTFTNGLDARNEDLKAFLARAHEVGSYSQLVADVDRFHATHFQR
ncbi:MAG: hypothetical protein B7Z66_15165 [Chromatiales bacterium 21-64-14]|nr:MAG: hypothetical protein B7Z66_15165 [Chromatiales bacterium 21-64-14]